MLSLCLLGFWPCCVAWLFSCHQQSRNEPSTASATPPSSGIALCLPVPWQQRCRACFATYTPPFKRSELPMHHTWCPAWTEDKTQRLLSFLPFCGGMPRSGSSPRAAQQDRESLRGLSVRAVPAVGAEPCVRGEGPAALLLCFHSCTAPAAHGKLGEPLPRARLYLGWVGLSRGKMAGFANTLACPQEQRQVVAVSRGWKSNSTCRLYGPGRGLCWWAAWREPQRSR